MTKSEFNRYLSDRTPEGCHITIADTPEYTQAEADELIAFVRKIRNAPRPQPGSYAKNGDGR